MLYAEDINLMKRFHDQLERLEIEAWNASESLPEEVLQQLLSNEDIIPNRPTAEELPSQHIDDTGQFHDGPIHTSISDKAQLPGGTPKIQISHFVDGSPRTVHTGFLLGKSGISYPIALSHVAASSVAFVRGRWHQTGFLDRHLILVAYKKMGINIEVSGKWELEDPTDRITNREVDVTDTVEMRCAAVRRARRKMALTEKDLVSTLANKFPQEWIAIDGSLFTVDGMYSDLKDFKIIGISKSFQHNPIVLNQEFESERIGYLVELLTTLPVGSRSRVFRLTPDRNIQSRYTYMWFIRIHKARQSPVSGIVKVELPPSERYLDDVLREQTVNAISHTIFRLRYPYLYDNRRGESFIYPIYVAESLVKSKLNSIEKIRGIWESSQY